MELPRANVIKVLLIYAELTCNLWESEQRKHFMNFSLTVLTIKYYIQSDKLLINIIINNQFSCS